MDKMLTRKAQVESLYCFVFYFIAFFNFLHFYFHLFSAYHFTGGVSGLMYAVSGNETDITELLLLQPGIDINR